MRTRFLIVGVLAACGGSTGPAAKTPISNTTETAQAPTRDAVVSEALLALGAGNVEKLMELADLKDLYAKGIQCKSDGREDDYGTDMQDLDRKLRKDFTSAVDKAKGATFEVVSIKNEIKSWTSSRRDARNASFVGKGGSVSKDCSARTDLIFHDVEVRLRVKKGADSKEVKVAVDLVHAGNRWYLLKMPKALSSAADDAISMMEKFSDRMCACKDKACADQVNDDMTKWGTEMARNASYDRDERPDPDMAKHAADVMTKYTECMTKLMMAGAGGTP